jgi:hypothetical protein
VIGFPPESLIAFGGPPGVRGRIVCARNQAFNGPALDLNIDFYRSAGDKFALPFTPLNSNRWASVVDRRFPGG